MGKSLVSVIIPCYNQGEYLKDALDSLKSCDPLSFEVIIINDGSTDSLTNEYIIKLYEEGYHVIFQENKGLGQARNNGIKQSKGKYILPLDADNKIHPDYITKGVQVLDKDSSVAVVYGNAHYFGQKKGILQPGPFVLQRLMIINYIDACAIIRKSVIEEVGYYDNMKIMGLEDWDLWLRIAFKNYKFHYLNEVLFDYRVNQNSMIENFNRNIGKQNAAEDYFASKYYGLLDLEYIYDYFIYKLKKRPFNFLYRFILKKYFPNYFSSLVKQDKIYKGYIYD